MLRMGCREYRVNIFTCPRPPCGDACAISPPLSGIWQASCGRSDLTEKSEVSVLVVEDEPFIALDLQAMAERAGYRVIGPANSVEAARLLTAQETPQLALLDVSLGRSSVFELADMLANLGTPIIFITGRSRTALPEAHKHRPLVVKPFQPETLLAAMREASRRLRG